MFVPGKSLYPSLIFVGEARELHVGSGLVYKHLTKLESLDRDKYSSLLWKIANYGVKSFIKLGPEVRDGLGAVAEEQLRGHHQGQIS